MAENPHAAAIGARESGEDRDQRRLAGAVGAEQAEELARLHGEVDAGERIDVAEATCEPVDLDRQRHVDAVCRSSRARNGRR